MRILKKKLKKEDIKVVSKEVAFWTNVREKVQNEMDASTSSLKFQMAVMDMINKKLAESK